MSGLALLVIATAAVAAGLTLWLSKPGNRLQVLDYPNTRSLHDRPIPRTGGLAIVVAAIVGLSAMAVEFDNMAWLGWIGAATVPVAVVSFLDDRRGVSVVVRLLAHSMAAVVLLTGGYRIENLNWPGGSVHLPSLISGLFSWALIVWMINLYNFMDGMDGFAGGMAVFGFGGLAVLGGMGGQMAFMAACLVVAAAAFGFLLFNFPPARIFMGDGGSAVLGLLVAAFLLTGQMRGVASLWVGILLFSPFVVDATVTLIRRILRGEAFWRPHREHYYQRAVQLGWGHHRTVLLEYGLMLGCLVSAAAAGGLRPSEQWAMIGAWSAAYAAMAAGICAMEKLRIQR